MTNSNHMMQRINETAIEKGRDLTEEEIDDIMIEQGICPQCSGRIGRSAETCETCYEYEHAQVEEREIDKAVEQDRS